MNGAAPPARNCQSTCSEIAQLTATPRMVTQCAPRRLTALPNSPAMEELKQGFHGATAMGLHAFTTLPFWLALAGVVTAYVFYLVKPGIPAAFARTFAPVAIAAMRP